MRLRADGVVSKAIQKATGHSMVGPFALRVMPHVDRFFSRVTRGHFVPSQLVVPTMVLTTTGAKTGLSRETPLATLPVGHGVWYVVGSNMGGSAHPGWSANLLKTPRATVLFHGTSTPVEAHLLDTVEKTEAWPKLRAVWPTYDRYAETAGRDLRVFRLTSTT
jgi:deazaflavin-dependent oxidoreductase (nitroreductase family)